MTTPEVVSCRGSTVDTLESEYYSEAIRPAWKRGALGDFFDYRSLESTLNSASRPEQTLRVANDSA